MLHKFFWSYLVIVQPLTVITLIPVYVEAQKQLNVSINIKIEVSEGLESLLMDTTFDSTLSSIHYNLTVRFTSQKSITKRNVTLCETEHKKVTNFANRNDTGAETIDLGPLIIFTKFADESIVTTLVLLILILLQDHVLSDILSHKVPILAAVVCLVSLLFVALVNVCSPDSSNFVLLMGSCLISVHSRSYWIWIWRSGFTSQFGNISNIVEIMRVVFHMLIVAVVYDVRTETDIFMLIKSWIFIYLLAFSVNYLLILDVTIWFVKRLQVQTREKILNDRSKDGVRKNMDSEVVDKKMDNNFDKKFEGCQYLCETYMFFFFSFAMCITINLLISSLEKENNYYSMNSAIVAKYFFEIGSVSSFWLMKNRFHEILIQIKEEFHKTNHCVYHSTEDIVGFGINLLRWLSPTFGCFNKNNYRKRRNTAAQFCYNRFGCIGSVLYENEVSLHFIHLAMIIVFLSIR